MGRLDEFLENCESLLIEAEDAAARGEPGMAELARCYALFLEDPAWWPVLEMVIELAETHGVKWSRA